MIDASVNVALLRCGDGALVPRSRRIELAGARQAVTHLMQAATEVLVIDAAVNVALLFRSDGALVPWSRRIERTNLQKVSGSGPTHCGAVRGCAGRGTWTCPICQ